MLELSKKLTKYCQVFIKLVNHLGKKWISFGQFDVKENINSDQGETDRHISLNQILPKPT